MASHYLDHLFSPRTIAVFGASDRSDSVGGRVFENLLEDEFEGTLYAINPKHSKVLGRPCYPSLQAIGEAVELAVMATPASTAPDIIHECGENGWCPGRGA
jgi:acetyltransferase